MSPVPTYPIREPQHVQPAPQTIEMVEMKKAGETQKMLVAVLDKLKLKAKAASGDEETAAETLIALLEGTGTQVATLTGQNVVLGQIKALAEKTNGRVTRLEKWKLILTTGAVAFGLSGAFVGWFCLTQLTFLRDLNEGRLRTIIKEEINAPAHIDKLRSRVQPRDSEPQLARQP